MLSARDLIKLAERHLGERYVLGARVPMSNSKWSGPWDCAEFTSWCVYQLTGTLFGCRPKSHSADIADAYTGYWAQDSKAAKSRIPINDAAGTAGAFLLREPPPRGIGHIAISCGDGRTVEAMGAKYGVTYGKVAGRRWDYGILVEGIEVTSRVVPFSIKPIANVLRMTTPPMSGAMVKRVQRALKARGYSPGAIDGIYGPQTAAAVQAFQVDKKLVPDAEVGPLTAKLLQIEWE